MFYSQFDNAKRYNSAGSNYYKNACKLEIFMATKVNVYTESD